MNDNLIPHAGLLEDSLSFLLAISFAKSSSHNYHLAVELARKSAKYHELNIGKNIIHSVAFAKRRDDAARASTIIQYILGWQSAIVYAGGKIIQDIFKVTAILQCYLEATACNDWTAHCQIVINDPYSKSPHAYAQSITLRVVLPGDPEPEKKEVEIERYIFPCKYLQSNFKFQIDHPAKPEDQIQAAAVHFGCDWCPKFNQYNYRKIGHTNKVFS